MNIRFATLTGGRKAKAQLMKVQCHIFIDLSNIFHLYTYKRENNRSSKRHNVCQLKSHTFNPASLFE